MKILPASWRQKRWQRISIDIVVFVGLFFLLQSWLQRDMVTGSAPKFTGVLLTGDSFHTGAMQNKPYLLHFWATWCGICKLEQSTIEAISRDYEVISVAMQSGQAAEIKAYMQKHQLTFPVVIDDEGIISRQYGVSGVPASFIINRSGEIAFVQRGYTTGWGLRARLWWAQR